MNPITPSRRPQSPRSALRDGVIAALSIVIGGSLGFASVTIAVETGAVPGLSIESFAYPSTS